MGEAFWTMRSSYGG